METKKALLTIIVILAFALIVTSVSQLTGFSVNSATIITVTPNTILPGDQVDIKVTPGQDIESKITILKSPSMTRVESLDLSCGTFKCKKGQVVSVSYKTSATEQPAKYIVKAYDLNGKDAGSASFTIL